MPTLGELKVTGPMSAERDRASNAHYKRKLRHSAWKWALHAALLVGVAGSQGPRGPEPTEDLVEQALTAPAPKGAPPGETSTDRAEGYQSHYLVFQCERALHHPHQGSSDPGQEG